ncbi:MAG: hypothetical protein PF638_14990 [Candidatus Delongbacteria bacterium]|jgi:hypothetical protein|nr:hypothetical protein [Candidatus Delongbacteria bacterium]
MEIKNKKDLVCLLILLIVILYGILARMSVINNTVVNHPIQGDAIDYFAYAKNLSLYSTYSNDYGEKDKLLKDAKRPPGFPLFASLFYEKVNNNSVQSVLTAQTIVQCLAFLTLSVLCWLFWGAWTSIVVSLLIWTHPAFMSINTYYITESLFLSSLIFVFSLFILSIRFKFPLLLVVLLGISVGLSALVRPTMEYYLLFIAFLLFFHSRQLLKKLWPAFVIFIIIILGWKIRNYFAIGSFSDPLLMINGLFHGSYPNFIYNTIPESYGFPYRFDPHENEYYNGIGTTFRLIWQRASEQPLKYISWYVIGKQFFLWQWNILSGVGDIFIYPIKESPFLYQADLQFWHAIHKFLNIPIMLIGIVYSYYIIIIGFVKKMPVDISYVIASLIVYASLFHVIVAPFPRYGIPFKVFVLVMFVLAIKSFVTSIKKEI